MDIQHCLRFATKAVAILFLSAKSVPGTELSALLILVH